MAGRSDAGQTIFINVTSHEQVPSPSSTADGSVPLTVSILRPHEEEGMRAAPAHRIAPQICHLHLTRRCVTGSEAQVCDVMLHPDVTSKAATQGP